ncbi:MAG TPA: TadE family protein [Candidatus Limnocylindrales bacterium]|nr:TadE family protein [Candidatus Limnocylindrales bacterium]
MSTRRFRRPSRDGGQSLAEFALVAPIFFLMLFAVIELALIMGGQNGLVASARELARYAATFRVASATDATAVCNLASNPDRGFTQQLNGFMSAQMPGYSASNWSTGERTVTYSWHPNADGTYFVQLEIHVIYHHPLYVPLVGAFLDQLDGSGDGKFRLDATETMRIENDGLANTYGDVSCNV